MNKILAVVFVALAAFAGTCYCATGTTGGFTAKYKMMNQNMYPNGYMEGTIYYWYDSKTAKNSRLRFETKISDQPNANPHVEFYHYGNSALYTICSKCQAAVLAYSPDYYGVIDGIDTCQEDAVYSGYKRCTRPPLSGAYGVVELVVKGELSDNNYDIKYVKYSDGRELVFTDGIQKIAKASDYKAKFETEGSGCPEPVCRSKMDIVFVLDASGSVDDTEWEQQKNFIAAAAKKFQLGEEDAEVGIVEFCAPTCCCQNGFKNCDCDNDYHNYNWFVFEDWLCPQENITQTFGTEYGRCVAQSCNWRGCWCTATIDYVDRRYASDCNFDTKCFIDSPNVNTAKVFMELTHTRVDDKISQLSNDKLSGNTCQRYGLVKAYEMLYGSGNTRCSDQDNREEADCPVPVVIVITDGAEYCPESTKEWAKKIREKDSRALLIEVGVGLSKDYDKDFLKGLVSLVGGEPAVLDVSGYNQVATILDKMISPVCSLGTTTTGTCGAGCNGYCACSDCICPHCTDEIPNCQEISCSDNLAYSGCRFKNITCQDQTITDPKCFNEYCDKEDGKCKTDPISCVPVVEEKLGRKMKKCESTFCSGGCDNAVAKKSDSWCIDNNDPESCKVWICDPDNDESDEETGCRKVDKECTVQFEGCEETICNTTLDECVGVRCQGPCYVYDENNMPSPRCEIKPCATMKCDDSADTPDDERCSWDPVKCPEKTNLCTVWVCETDAHGNNVCVEQEDTEEVNKCAAKNKKDGCRTWRCDRYAASESEEYEQGACVGTVRDLDMDNCLDYMCDDNDEWVVTPRCTSTQACKLTRCDDKDGSCFDVDIDCYAKVDIPNKCFEAACREPDGCYKKQYRDAYFDVCGNCISSNAADSAASFSSETMMECTMTSEEELHTEGLAAAAIALIVIGAILIGAAVGLSSVVGTKALLDRANNAADQAVVSNPLFEDSQAEMTNPAFVGNA